ncbi:MAG: hypothetical protein R3316_08730, partial [Rhodovibrionaceae bacterium]|nr:hypothetical protein [Rhodovibrionaceae bacterium]
SFAGAHIVVLSDKPAQADDANMRLCVKRRINVVYTRAQRHWIAGAHGTWCAIRGIAMLASAQAR